MKKLGSTFRQVRRRAARSAAKIVNIVLIFALAYQTVFGCGVAFAIAEGVNAVEAGASSGLGSGEDASNDQAGADVGSLGERGPGDASGDADTSTPEHGAEGSPQGDAGDGTGDGAEGDGESASSLAEREEVRAWEGSLDALDLASDGMVFAEPDEDDMPAELPGDLEATLNLAFTLDPAEWASNPEGVRAAVIAGDTITVPLPEGISAASDDETYDVCQRDGDGNTTSIRIATARIVDDAIEITFVDPQDTETGEAYLMGAEPDEASDKAAMAVLPVLRASVDFDVLVSSGLVEDEEHELTWTLQTAEGTDSAGESQTAALRIPARAELVELLGIEDAAADEEDGPSAQPDGANMLRAVTGESVTVEAGPFDARISATITWCDNNAGDRPAASDLAAGFIPQYSLDGSTYRDLVDGSGEVTDQARADLHLDDEDVARIKGSALASVTQSAVGTYDVLSAALPGSIVTTTKAPVLDENGDPTYDENGEQVFETTTESATVSWRFNDVNEYPGYIDGQNSTWEHRYKMLTGRVSFTVVGKIGSKKLKDVFQEDEAKDFHFGALIDNEDQGSTSIAEAIDEGWLAIEETDTGAIVSGELPVYSQDGYPIVYYIKYAGEQDTNDYYQPTYNNAASPSHGSATDAAYDGGTMTLRHAGTTTYYGVKEWLDDSANEDRPSATFTLWRYSLNGGSASTASQVSLPTSEGSEASAGKTSEYVSVTIPAGSEKDSVDLHELLKEAYGDAIEELPKYDPDGYPYVYALREEAVPGYEQVFGDVAQDGTVDEAAPTYQLPDGTWTTVDDGTSSAGSGLIYNAGDNEDKVVITNRRTGTATVELTKTWEIAAFQDSLQDVVCEFTAQSRPANSDDDADWKDVDAEGAVQTLTGWNAETLTKTITESFPRYDDQGRELEYRWIESNVTLEGQETEFARGDDGAATFKIQVKDAEGLDETLEFTSSIDEEGDAGTTITNSFQNITDQHVDKYWEQPDGTLAQIAPDPQYSDGDAVIELYRDGELIGTFTLDGEVDQAPTAISGLDDATWQETAAYHGDFENLPKYSPDGVRHTYLVLETPKEGWSSERSYDAEGRLTRIDNYFAEGEGSEIRLTKSWIDGDDAAHRLKVEVQLVAKHDMASKATNDDGTPRHSYEADEVVMSGIILSEDELWYAEVDVPIGGLSYKDFTLVETALIDDQGTEDTSDDVRYPVLTHDEASAHEEYKEELWLNAGWTNPSNRRVATDEHVYEVRSTENTELRACAVTNRRLGLLDLTVQKAWHDGLGTIAEGAEDDNPRPDAVLTLSCVEYGDAFFVNADGELYVSVSGNSLPVLNGEDEPVHAQIVDEDGNPAEHGNAQVEVDASAERSTYEFFGLPKYDANGLNVHYSVSEDWQGDAGDYRSIKTEGEYMVEEGARHFHDTQTIEFDNARTGTRDVVFYKSWHDAYVSETLGQRPDIYLTLYRMTDGGTPEVVSGYVHVSWEANAEGGDATNEQKVTFSGLPKYDDEGKEYIYYATETMPADGVSLDYAPVRFDYASINAADASDDEVGSVVADADDAVKVDESAGDDPTENGTGWAIREDGTFVNRLEDNLTVQGTKLWENIPGNVDQDDLPEVTVYLQRKLANESDWPEMYLKKNDSGDWVVQGGAVSETSELTEVTTNQYSYTMTEDYKGNGLPRYDENGNLFEYRAIEVAWGLHDTPGGFDDSDLDPDGDGVSVDLSDKRDGDSDTDFAGTIYVVQHGETGSFLLRNVYGGDATGKLTVKKLFSGRDANDAYPDVTFDVYRYYVDKGGTSSAAQRVASHTITANEFAAGAGSATDPTQPTIDAANGSATYTFENLDIYAPDGSRWIYYVVERSINGYESTVGCGDIASADDVNLVTGDAVDGGMRSNDLGTRDATAVADDELVDVTFANTYTPGVVDLNGTKEWDDYGNIFSVRPDSIDLAFTRSAGSMNESVVTQDSDPDGENYLTWETDDAGNWTFTLENVEQWAPNGRAWTYTVTETMPEDASPAYTIVTGSSSVQAGSSAPFRLENAMDGRVTVEKRWEDGDDPYGLRPSTVTVQLQARYRAVEDDGPADAWSDWQNAYAAWSHFAPPGDLESSGLTEAQTERNLSDENGWRASWSRMPLRAQHEDDVCEIEYRVVEVKVGDQDISGDVNTSDAADESVYDTVYPYQPSHETLEAPEGSFKTLITNTLDDASVMASKSWEGDAVGDVDDAWGTRPGSGDTWTATYFLQRSSNDGTTWEWVVEAGANPATSAADPGVVSLEISNGMTPDENHEVTESDGSVTVTWKNLPAHSTGGNQYQYRIVEQVPGSYDVQGAELVSDSDTAHRYYVVGSSTGTQAYTNTLRTVELTGTKKWEDFGTGIAESLDEDDMPTMVLYRAVKNDNGSWSETERVTMKDGSQAPQPTWSKAGDGTWTFTYEGLPAANEDDEPYTYWAEEQTVGEVDGYYPLYKTADAEGTTVNGSTQENTTITNVATRLTLAKASDFAGDDPALLANVELSVLSEDGETTYAIWTNGADGETYSSTTWVNGTTEPDNETGSVTRNDGLIVGLPAGDYIVRETGGLPDGYAQAADVSLHINADGSATGTGVTTTTDDDGTKTIGVTLTDPVFRAHFRIHKVLGTSGGSLAGVTFDLYSGTPDGAHALIATGITTDENGSFTSVGSDIERVDNAGSKYETLADGLLYGEYYLVETGTTDTAYLPSGDDATYPFTIARDDHGKTIAVSDHGGTTDTDLSNTPFTATFNLRKYDTTTDEGIKGAMFSLYRDANDNGTYEASEIVRQGIASDEDGGISFTVSAKGSYQLVETANTGYDLTGPFTATFKVDNEDHGQTFDLTTRGGQEAVDFEVTQGKVDADGIPNDRLTGMVTLNKRGDNESIDATFELQVKVDDTWQTVVGGLETSVRYELAWNGDGLTATATKTDDLATGILQVAGLTWNTYRFQETDTAGGYLPENANGPLTSTEFSIDRENAAKTTIGVTLANAQTSLVLHKQGEDGDKLAGTVFTVAGADGATLANGRESMQITTGSDGVARLDGQLVVGCTYTLYEEQATEGYDPIDSAVRFTVQRDGSLEVDGELPAGYAWTDADGNGSADNAFELTVTNPYISIDLIKVNEEGEGLPDAAFTLIGRGMDGETVRTVTTGEDGVATLEGLLIAGVNYTLTEQTPPAGYATMGTSLQFSVTYRGVLSVAGDLPQGWAIEDGSLAMTATDEPVELQLTKRAPDAADGTAGALLDGAVFTVTPVGETAFADGSTEALRLTTEDGVAASTAQLVVGGTYDITEISAPDGYERVTGIMRVTVAEDGTINVAGSVDDEGSVTGALPPTGYERVADNAFEVRVTNEPIEIAINKVSAADGATRLNGATFEVTGVFANGTERETRAFTTDDDGRLAGVANISVELKSGETYELTETVAPAGYELIEGTLSFSVAEDGTVSAVGEVPAGYTIEQAGVSIVAADAPIEVALAKRDLGDTPLAGASFELAGTFVNDATHETVALEIPLTTTEDALTLACLAHDGGTYSLVAGETYTLTEGVAPDGYELLDPFSFTVAPDGTISAARGSEEAAAGEPGYAIEAEDGTVTLTAHDRPIEVELYKTDGSDALAGAEFELYRGASAEDGTLVGSVTTGDGGTVTLADLTGGTTYTLREVAAPDGYELLPDVTFTVGVDGTVELAEGHEGYAVANADDGTATITAQDEPIRAQVLKTDAAGTPLAGARFTIEPSDGSAFAGSPELNEDGALELAPTGSDGVAQVPAGVLVAGDTYRIAEVAAPEGYELAGSATFTVDEHGDVAIAGAAGGDAVAGADGSGTYAVSVEDGMAVLTATDAPVELAVVKAAAEGDTGSTSYLAGAEFTLAEIPGTGSETGEEGDAAAEPQVFTGTTDEDGRLTWTGLTAGASYVLRETKAPAGYELLDDTATLAVAEDGTVSISDGNESGAFAVGEDGASIQVLDRHLGVSLVKTDPEGAGLEGGVFTLEPVEGAFPDGTVEKTFASDAFGAVFTDLMLTGSAEGTAYVLTEITAPAGYELLAPFTILVYEDGTVGLADDVTGALAGQVEIVNDAEDGIAVISVSDVPIELELRKISTGGEALSGATFTVAGRFADGSAEQSLTVGSDGVVELPSVIAGESYTLTETAAPAGYDRIEGSWTFTVRSDGTIEAQATSTVSVFGGRSVGYAVSDDGLAILAVDTETPSTEKVPGTGDMMSTLVLACVVGGMVALIGGAFLRRRRR